MTRVSKCSRTSSRRMEIPHTLSSAVLPSTALFLPSKHTTPAWPETSFPVAQTLIAAPPHEAHPLLIQDGSGPHSPSLTSLNHVFLTRGPWFPVEHKRGVTLKQRHHHCHKHSGTCTSVTIFSQVTPCTRSPCPGLEFQDLLTALNLYLEFLGLQQPLGFLVGNWYCLSL